MKIYGMVRKYGVTFFAGIIFAVLCFVGINAAMAPTSKSDYCGSKCHEMNTAYRSWELSVHGSNKYGIRVECVDCHLPAKDKYFRYIAAKAHAGAKDVYKHYFGGEYDVEEIREQVLAGMANRRCMNCHDDLLAKPGDSAARMAHVELLSQGDELEIKCVDCHESVGHERQSKLFSP
ncbi:MAG: cytochrome c3 family protein [Planctomycetota bacterium]|jgi:cytochrome c nitrite reductase small subunit